MRRNSTFNVLGWAGLLLALVSCSRSATPVPVAAISQETEVAEMPPRVVLSPRPEQKAISELLKEGFSFPADRGGELLTRRLPPPGSVPGTDIVPTQPKARAGSSLLDNPVVPLPPHAGAIPRLPESKKGKAPRPADLAEELPFGGYRGEPARPHEVVLPVGDRIRTTGPDVGHPMALSHLGQPVADRASLEDPTAETSAAAVRSATPMARGTPVPFLRLTIPDPFEHREAGRLRNPPVDQ